MQISALGPPTPPSITALLSGRYRLAGRNGKVAKIAGLDSHLNHEIVVWRWLCLLSKDASFRVGVRKHRPERRSTRFRPPIGQNYPRSQRFLGRDFDRHAGAAATG